MESCGWNGTLWLSNSPAEPSLLATIYRVPSGCCVRTRLSASALPRGQSTSASPPVTTTAPPGTTYFFTLVRKYSHVDAKLASTHLSWFWSWIHLVSPTGLQQMARWAHVLGEGMGWGCLMLGDCEGWSFTTLPISHILIFQPQSQDHSHLCHYCWWQCHSFRCPGTNPFSPWLAFRYLENYYAPSLWLLFARPKSPGLQPFPWSPGFGALHWWIFSGKTQTDRCPSPSLALETRHSIPAVIYRPVEQNYYLLLFFGFKKAGLKSK